VSGRPHIGDTLAMLPQLQLAQRATRAHRPSSRGRPVTHMRASRRSEFRGAPEAQTSRYIDGVDPIVLASARRHGVADQDILHGYRNPVRVFQFDDLTMLIGADEAGRVLEIGMATAEGLELIVHAMPAREKFLR